MDTNYGKIAMNRNFSSLMQAQGEKRLKELDVAARSLGSLVAGEQLKRATVINSLLSACKRNGLHKEIGEPEVMTLIQREPVGSPWRHRREAGGYGEWQVKSG